MDLRNAPSVAACEGYQRLSNSSNRLIVTWGSSDENKTQNDDLRGESTGEGKGVSFADWQRRLRNSQRNFACRKRRNWRVGVGLKRRRRRRGRGGKRRRETTRRKRGRKKEEEEEERKKRGSRNCYRNLEIGSEKKSEDSIVGWKVLKLKLSICA